MKKRYYNSTTKEWYTEGSTMTKRVENEKPLVGLKRRRVAEANMFLGYDKYYLDEKNNIKKK